jgi:hypothetical protein
LIGECEFMINVRLLETLTYKKRPPVTRWPFLMFHSLLVNEGLGPLVYFTLWL